MDFIMKLLRSKDPVINDTFNFIYIIVDKFIKYAHIILYKETYKIILIAFVVLDRIIKYYNIPAFIISD